MVAKGTAVASDQKLRPCYLCRQRLSRIDGCDELATDYEFFQIIAIAEGVVVQQPKPEIGGKIFRRCRFEECRVKHETVF